MRREVERQRAAETKAASEPPQGKSQGTASGRYHQASENARQIAVVDFEIGRLKAEERQLKGQIGLYQQRVEATPRVEEALMAITRDYDITRKNYQSLLDKQIEAQMAENLEKRQQGEQFRVIDPAQLPETPFRPNVPRLLLLSLALGLASGGGLALLREYLDRSFKTEEELEEFLGVAPAAIIPLVETIEARKAASRRKRLALGAGAAVLMAYCGLLAYFKVAGVCLQLPFLS
jgi:uncharacterized protein involved in exopolysaccharide biosynthesis